MKNNLTSGKNSPAKNIKDSRNDKLWDLRNKNLEYNDVAVNKISNKGENIRGKDFRTIS